MPIYSIENSYSSTAISSAENPAGGNSMRWVNAEADAAIEVAGSRVDVATRQAAYCDLAELIATKLSAIHLYLFTEGYEVNMWGSLTWDVQSGSGLSKSHASG